MISYHRSNYCVCVAWWCNYTVNGHHSLSVHAMHPTEQTHNHDMMTPMMGGGCKIMILQLWVLCAQLLRVHCMAYIIWAWHIYCLHALCVLLLLLSWADHTVGWFPGGDRVVCFSCCHWCCVCCCLRSYCVHKYTVAYVWHDYVMVCVVLVAWLLRCHDFVTMGWLTKMASFIGGAFSVAVALLLVALLLVRTRQGNSVLFALLVCWCLSDGLQIWGSILVPRPIWGVCFGWTYSLYTRARTTIWTFCSKIPKNKTYFCTHNLIMQRYRVLCYFDQESPRVGAPKIGHLGPTYDLFWPIFGPHVLQNGIKIGPIIIDHSISRNTNYDIIMCTNASICAS